MYTLCSHKMKETVLSLPIISKVMVMVKADLLCFQQIVQGRWKNNDSREKEALETYEMLCFYS